MGISIQNLKFLENFIDINLKKDKIKMIELGNQYIKGGKVPTGRIAKKYFESIGIDHTSIDLNGEDGALPINLNIKIKDDELINQFDILTNFGTSEHVKDQYFCWLNIHNLVKKDGIFVHLLPVVKNWRGHGFYKYTKKFFINLSNKCGYEVIELFNRNNIQNRKMIMCVMRKNNDKQFISNIDFHIIYPKKE